MLATTVAGNEMSKESHIVGGSLVGLDNKPVTTEAAKNHVELVDMIDMLSEQHPDIEKIQFITALNPGEATEITIGSTLASRQDLCTDGGDCAKN